MSIRTEPHSRYTSALAAAIDSIPLRVRRAFGLPEVTLELLDLAILTVRAVLDDNDPRSLDERLSQSASKLETLIPDDGITEARMQAWGDRLVDDVIPRFLKFIERAKNPGGKSFWLRLLGTRSFDRFTSALRDDGALLIVGTRRLIRWFLPIAAAIDEAASVLPEDKRHGLTNGEKGLLDALFMLDEQIDNLVTSKDIHLDDVPLRDGEDHTFGVSVEEMLGYLRVALQSDVLTLVADLSDRLARKLRGFEDALNGSADGVSQAANSLIEFLDRLLRESFDDEFVTAWIREHFPDEDDMIYRKDGVDRPTKRAQALCFAYGGTKPVGDGKLQMMLADSVAEVRRQIQRLKHADQGTPEEIAALQEQMNAVRGFFVVSLRMGWAGDAERLADLHERFAPAA